VQGIDFWAGNSRRLSPYSARTREVSVRGTGKNNGKNKGLMKWQQTDRICRTLFSIKIPVTVFLINGVKLQGVITWFDNFCILLRRDGQSQLVYKHAVSTIMPSQPVNLYDGDDAGQS
jgi:host factor-I protein